MARILPKKDVVIIGLGWTGSVMANELTDEGLDVIAIERGPWRDAPTDFPPSQMQDELRYRIRHELFLRPDQLTFTVRPAWSDRLHQPVEKSCGRHHRANLPERANYLEARTRTGRWAWGSAQPVSSLFVARLGHGV
jgi:choline dehydrogenase-like flavoprotein